MDTKTISTGIGGIIIGGLLMLSTSTGAQTFEKISPTDVKITQQVSVTISLSDLKDKLATAQKNRQYELDESASRIAQFDLIIADLTSQISQAEKLGVKEDPTQ